MKYHVRKWHLVLVLILLSGLFWGMLMLIRNSGESLNRRSRSQAIPVEVAKIQRGPIELRRIFSGALESTAEFMVSPKVSGRVTHLAVDLADRIHRGQVVARLDDDEYVQAVAQAKADLAVAQANHHEARNTLEIANRELNRVQTLRERGVASDSQLDSAKTEQLAANAKLEVTSAHVVKAEAALETARIRLNYTKVSADWTGGDDDRILAERFIDEGNTVAANTPLMSIMELDPITGVIFVTEKDYARLSPGQSVSIFTDAFANETFSGNISRIAPVFKEATRQARVEITIKNVDHRLKPGMFIRAMVVLDRVEDAIIIPETALTVRNDHPGVFVVDHDTKTVSWYHVDVGIRDEDRIQVNGSDLSGSVVTLGQQLLDDGSTITLPEQQTVDALSSKEALK